MIANPQNYKKMTAEEYLEWESQQELRHEYVDGEILAMTGGTIAHNEIALKVVNLISYEKDYEQNDFKN